MADVVSVAVRSRMMAGIRGKNTKPELIIRRGLHARGFRYILHDKRLPGKPDLVFPKYRAVIFVHGCFWHRHDCHLFKWPKTRKGFWRKKIERNREIDESAIIRLLNSGWRCCVVWECALKGRESIPTELVLDECFRWLCSRRKHNELRGATRK
jgi:DNA mismatch endonuclease (patch repair protein)